MWLVIDGVLPSRCTQAVSFYRRLHGFVLWVYDVNSFWSKDIKHSCSAINWKLCPAINTVNWEQIKRIKNLLIFFPAYWNAPFLPICFFKCSRTDISLKFILRGFILATTVTGQLLWCRKTTISHANSYLFFPRSLRGLFSLSCLEWHYNCTYPLQKFLAKTGEPGGERNRIITGGV